MEEQNIAEIVHNHFPQLIEKELIEEITKVGRLEKVSRGEIVIDIDEPIDYLPLLYQGTMKIHREDDEGREILLYYVEAGNTCAQSLTCCMSETYSTIRAEAEEETHFVAVPIRYLDDWMAKYPSWKKFVMNTYFHRFEELLNTIDELAFKKLDERLLGYLMGKAEVTGSNLLNVSHREIAYDLNSSREVISRLLKQLEKIGEIKLGRGKIELLAGAELV